MIDDAWSLLLERWHHDLPSKSTILQQQTGLSQKTHKSDDLLFQQTWKVNPPCFGCPFLPEENVKCYLINFPISTWVWVDNVLSFFSVNWQSNCTRVIWTILPQCQDVNQTCSLSYQYKFWGCNQIRLDLVQLFCNSICVQHKMVGGAYPSILECLVHRKKGYSSSLGDTHLSLELPSVYLCWTS